MARHPVNAKETLLKPLLNHINTDSGVFNDDLDFNYGSEVSATHGCGVTLRGQFWYLGGRDPSEQYETYNRQVNLDMFKIPYLDNVKKK